MANENCEALQALLKVVHEQLDDERKAQQEYGSLSGSLRDAGLNASAYVTDTILGQESEHELQLIELKRVIKEELRKCDISVAVANEHQFSLFHKPVVVDVIKFTDGTEVQLIQKGDNFAIKTYVPPSVSMKGAFKQSKETFSVLNDIVSKLRDTDAINIGSGYFAKTHTYKYKIPGGEKLFITNSWVGNMESEYANIYTSGYKGDESFLRNVMKNIRELKG